MKIYKHLLSILAIAATAFSLQAQSIVDLRLNEILINNEDNYTDEFSRHKPWVEVYNSAYNSLDVGGCYLTNDTTGFAAAQKNKADLEKFKIKCYKIPVGDPKTLLQQRSSVVFFLDGDSTYGTFHVNFTPDKTNYVALIAPDGKTLIDVLKFPEKLRDSCISFGCLIDGDTTTRQELPNFTPCASNQVSSSESKSDNLERTDPYGFKMAISAMSIVFLVLIIIYAILKVFGYFSKKAARTKKGHGSVAPAAAGNIQPTGEECVAIATALARETGDVPDDEKVAIFTALYLYFDARHDQESEVLTFDYLNRESAWGQKYLNFKRNPRK